MTRKGNGMDVNGSIMHNKSNKIYRLMFGTRNLATKID